MNILSRIFDNSPRRDFAKDQQTYQVNDILDENGGLITVDPQVIENKENRRTPTVFVNGNQ